MVVWWCWWWAVLGTLCHAQEPIIVGSAHLTILTPRLIRLQYGSPYEHRPSLTAVNRTFPPVHYNKTVTPTTATLKTSAFTLVYNGGPFTNESLHVAIHTTGFKGEWWPGMVDQKNLLGTITSWNEEHDLTRHGLLSRNGWYVIDDTHTPVFVEPERHTRWGQWVAPRHKGGVDWYLLACGLDYTACLQDYAHLSGPINLPPASAFGIWWSRYFAYDQQTFTSQVLEGYANHSLPLSHIVLDVDWHTRPKKSIKGCDGFGGYNWNKKLWPDPISFISAVHSGTTPVKHPLKMLLNTHSFTGVDHCQETMYNKVAEAMGINPSTKQLITCDLTNLTYMKSLYEFCLDVNPIDYWWTDGALSRWVGMGSLSNMWNLVWFTHTHDTSLKNSGKRPLVLTRWGGLGQHRYPIGFSGDASSTWLQLQKEINMTKIAANVLFGYWSHDIGGFNGDPTDELFLRWIQFGAVSPILRTHSNHGERRIWVYPSFHLMAEAFSFRHALTPYLYTSAWQSVTSSIATIHPMYYHYPTHEESYQTPFQHMVGSLAFARPVEIPVDNTTGKVDVNVWIPTGDWVDWSSSKIVKGPSSIQYTATKASLPFYVKSGSIIPMTSNQSHNLGCPDPLNVVIMPGSTQGTGVLYCDDGDTTSIDSAVTQLSYSQIDVNHIEVIVHSAVGSYSGMPEKREVGVQLRGVKVPSSVMCDGETVPKGSGIPGWVVVMHSTLTIPAGTIDVSVGRKSLHSAVHCDVRWS